MKQPITMIFLLAVFLNSHSVSTRDIYNENHVMQDTAKKPSAYIEEAWVDTMTILCIKDTAVSMADISRAIGAGYGELFTYINQTGLQPGRVMAFYITYKPPIIMKTAVEVNRVPDKLAGRIRVDKIPAGSAIIAHYKGPYEKVEFAYNAIADWLKQHKKEAARPPFEVYLNDPATVKDPYELRTDVYQFLK